MAAGAGGHQPASESLLWAFRGRVSGDNGSGEAKCNQGPSEQERDVMTTTWRYQDARGVVVEGTYEGSADYGGSDVVYRMRRKDGTLDILSGLRLKAAKVIRREMTRV